MLATQRKFCLIERKTGQFIAIFGIWNRKRTESVRRFNRRFAHTLKLATEPNRAAVRFGSVRTDFRFGSLFSLLRTFQHNKDKENKKIGPIASCVKVGNTVDIESA